MRRRKKNEQGQEVCPSGHVMIPENTDARNKCIARKAEQRAKWAAIHRPGKGKAVAAPIPKTAKFRVEVWRTVSELCRGNVEVAAASAREAKAIIQESIDALYRPTYELKEGEQTIDNLVGDWQDSFSAEFPEGHCKSSYRIKKVEEEAPSEPAPEPVAAPKPEPANLAALKKAMDDAHVAYEAALADMREKQHTYFTCSRRDDLDPGLVRRAELAKTKAVRRATLAEKAWTKARRKCQNERASLGMPVQDTVAAPIAAAAPASEPGPEPEAALIKPALI